MDIKVFHSERSFGRTAANDGACPPGDDCDDLYVFISPGFQARLRAVCKPGTINTQGWSDSHVARFLLLLRAGYDERDAAAVISGDAVIEADGRVNHEPGCSWIDAIVKRRHR